MGKNMGLELRSLPESTLLRGIKIATLCIIEIINVFSSEPRPIGDISLWGRRERGVLNLIVKTLLLSLIQILNDYSNLLRYL